MNYINKHTIMFVMLFALLAGFSNIRAMQPLRKGLSVPSRRTLNSGLGKQLYFSTVSQPEQNTTKHQKPRYRDTFVFAGLMGAPLSVLTGPMMEASEISMPAGYALPPLVIFAIGNGLYLHSRYIFNKQQAGNEVAQKSVQKHA